MAETVIDALHKSNAEVLSYLLAANEVSMYSDLDDKLKKVLVMSAASFFETELRAVIETFVAQCSSSNQALVALVRNKAIERQFHTYFNWRERQANAFFSLFGDTFSKHCREATKQDKALSDSVSAFLELGEMRNELAHRNFGAFPVQKTSAEIYLLYQSGSRFIEFMRKKLVEENGLMQLGDPGRPSLHMAGASQPSPKSLG